MKVTLVRGHELSADLVATWRAIQDANPSLRSPYFCPEFTQLAAETGLPVEVAVMEDAGRIAAFFPFQRNGRIGGPVGGILSDYQGVIASPEFAFNPVELVRKCGLAVWDFDHLLTGQSSFSRFHRETAESPIIDLTTGYQAYTSACHAVKAEQRKVRRVERELGPLRFVTHTLDANVLQQTLAWKSQQYLAEGNPDLFAIDWVRQIVEKILNKQTPEFAGVLSALYAGDTLIAGHLGMRSRSVWHWWFPSYDSVQGRHSPGMLLLLKLAESAPQLGLNIVDLGAGMSLYKQRVMNGSIPIASGSVEVPSWLSIKRGLLRNIRSAARAMPLARRVVGWARGSTKRDNS